MVLIVNVKLDISTRKYKLTLIVFVDIEMNKSKTSPKIQKENLFSIACMIVVLNVSKQKEIILIIFK